MLESEKFDLIIFLFSLPLLGVIVYRLYSSFFRKGYHLPMAIEKEVTRKAAQALFFIYSLFICFWPILLLIGKSVLLIIYGKGPVDAGGGIILALPILIFSFIFDIAVSIAFTVYVFDPIKNSYESPQTMPKSNILSKSSKHAIVALVFVIIADFAMLLTPIIYEYNKLQEDKWIQERKRQEEYKKTQYMSHLESNLYYPNAKMYSKETHSIIQLNPKSKYEKKLGDYFLSEDQPDKIFQWYDNWLTLHGWERIGSGYRIVGRPRTSERYKRGENEVFEVEINDPLDYSSSLSKIIFHIPQELMNSYTSQGLTIFGTDYWVN